MDPRSRRRVYKTEAVSKRGMVTAMHGLAAEAGVEVLTAGGNAADAAIAALLASGVVEPFMSGLGGAAYAITFDRRSGSVRCIDGAVSVPGEATEDMFELAAASEPRKGLYGWAPTKDDASETGPRSIGVPGALATLSRLHGDMGKTPWADLVAPAIRLAEQGFPVDEYYFVNAAAAEARLRPYAATTDVFLTADGTALQPPDAVLKQPALAATLRTIAKNGAASFYQGPIADAIVSWVRANEGILASSDLASYAVTAPAPRQVRYGGYDLQLLSDGSGGPTVARALEILAERNLAALDFDAVDRLDAIAEALKVSFTERLQTQPDPPGQHTTHVNAVDSDRNMVALTATLGTRFGSAVTVPELGVVLNNGMMWFDPEPGRPNAIRPGRRALHAAAPCVLLDGGEPRAALGAPGARRIMSAVLQVLLAMIDHGMGAQAAVDAPRIHCEDRPPLFIDARFSSAVCEGLRARGRVIAPRADSLVESHFGRPSVIQVDARDGVLRGGVEVHRASTAIGY